MEGEPSTSKCQASSVFDDDSPEEAKWEITNAMHSLLLTSVAKGKYIMDHVSNSSSL
jgi:hypothetical protein